MCCSVYKWCSEPLIFRVTKRKMVAKKGGLVDMKGRRKPYDHFTYPHAKNRPTNITLEFLWWDRTYFSELSLPLRRVRKKILKKKIPIDLHSTKFPRCLGAEHKKSMFFCVVSVTASLPSEQGLVGCVSSINMLSAFYAQKRWPIALPVSRSSTRECFYKPAKKLASFLCSELHRLTSECYSSKDFANLLQNSCVTYFYQFCPNWHRLQTGLA